MKKTLLFIMVSVIILVSMPLFVGAQDDCPNGIICIPNPLQYDKIEDIIKAITGFLKILAIPIASAMIIISGIQYLLSAGNVEKSQKAKKTITYTLIGLAIILAVDFIVGIAQEILGRINDS